MFQVLYFFIHAIQPILIPLCLVLAWGLIFLLVWSLIAALKDTLHRAKRMHKIPCAHCSFFTKDYHLKCPVQPLIALSEKAIDCPDFCTTRAEYPNDPS